MKCYAETAPSNALFRGVKLTDFHLINSCGCVRQQYLLIPIPHTIYDTSQPGTVPTYPNEDLLAKVADVFSLMLILI